MIRARSPRFRTTRPNRRAASALVLVWCLVRGVAAQPVNPDELYRQGVELAKAGRLEEARTRFEAAFEQSPHPRVLYTLAKVSLEMNDKEAAKSYLRRYLEMDLSSVPPDEPSQVRAALEALEAETPSSAPPPEPTPAPESKVPTEDPPPGPEERAAPPPPDAAPKPPAVPVSPTPSADTEAPPATSNPLPLVFTSAGAATALSGLVLWLWSDSLHSELSSDYEQLGQNMPPSPTRSEEVAPALEHAREVGRTEGSFDSVDRLDVAAATLLGIGGACLVTGIVWYLLDGDEAAPKQARPVDVAIVPRGVKVRW